MSAFPCPPSLFFNPSHILKEYYSDVKSFPFSVLATQSWMLLNPALDLLFLTFVQLFHHLSAAYSITIGLE